MNLIGLLGQLVSGIIMMAYRRTSRAGVIDEEML